MKKIFRTSCDMGSIKIFNDDMSVFFLNQIGDLPNTVEIRKKRADGHTGEFLGHFTVKSKPAYLSSYDCDDDAIYKFGKGRWFVHLKEAGHFIISLQDQDIHA